MNLQMSFIRAVCLTAFCIAGLAAASLSAATPGVEGIVVRGEGTAKARPTQIEMSATISGDAPLAADALVKFRDAKRRALAAIAGLKNPDLSIESEGVSVNSGMADAQTQMMVMRGMAVPNAGQGVHLAETNRITLAHTDKLPSEELLEKVLKILDVAKDAGFQIGPAPARNYYEMQIRAQQGDDSSATVSFRLPDTGKLREEAYQSAIDDAKAKAQRLADLAGAKLGPILAVQDPGEPGAEAKTISGSTSGDVTYHVNLEVHFELVR